MWTRAHGADVRPRDTRLRGSVDPSTEPTFGAFVTALRLKWTPRAHGADKEPDGLRLSDVVDPSRARSRLSTLTVACGVWRADRRD